MNLKIKAWNLRNKVILHVLVIGLLTALLLSYVFIRTQRNVVQTMSREKVELVSSLVERSLFLFMKEGRITQLESTLGEIAASHDIQNIRIIDRQGKILHSSELRDVGRFEEAQPIERLNDFLSQNNHSRLFFVKSKSMIQGLSLIENKGVCLSCHSDRKDINGVLEVAIDYSATAALLRSSQFKAIILAFISLSTLSFVILRLFNRLVNRPIFELKDKMRKVQEGDLSVPLKSTRTDEIGSLSRAFDVMVQRLKDSNQKIQELFDKQMEKVEHLASIGELAAGLAHEIKNPIAGIMGALEIIIEKMDPADPQGEIFSEMLLQIEKINAIIQDLLSYARPKEMIVSLVNPDDCVRNAIKLAQPQVKNKKIQFELRGLGDGALALVDADKIEQVLLNLMLNSISAIDRQGRILVELQRRSEDGLLISFSDTGAGIKKEFLPQIFTPFFTTKSRGTGLGLSICKKIIEAHGGTIRVVSQEREGTTFSIELPVLRPRRNP